jgi:hypothetical protein
MHFPDCTREYFHAIRTGENDEIKRLDFLYSVIQYAQIGWIIVWDDFNRWETQCREETKNAIKWSRKSATREAGLGNLAGLVDECCGKKWH